MPGLLKGVLPLAGVAFWSGAALAEPLPPDSTSPAAAYTSEILPVALGHLETAQNVEAKMTGKASYRPDPSTAGELR